MSACRRHPRPLFGAWLIGVREAQSKIASVQRISYEEADLTYASCYYFDAAQPIYDTEPDLSWAARREVWVQHL